jgi:cytochrome P450
MDLIADFAFRLPVTVICDMLGIPKEARDVFFTGSRAGGRLLDLAPLSKAEIEEQNSCATWQWPNISASCLSCADASLATTSPRISFRLRKRQ